MGRQYNLFDYVGDPEAERVVVSMASSCDVIEETVNYLTGLGERVGLIKVRLYLPFSREHFLSVLPATAQRIACSGQDQSPRGPSESLYTRMYAPFFRKGAKPRLLWVAGMVWGARISPRPWSRPYLTVYVPGHPKIILQWAL